MDLSNYTIEQLDQIKKDIDKEIVNRKKENAKRAQQELKKVAESYGFNLADLVGGAPVRARKKAAAQFQNPNDASQTWSGRGRKPAWVKAWESAGRSIEDLRIA
ncbi:H-NS histone family protein [Spiribacter sp. C176]|uniref:H-NS histone family protein n=1 Tax=Spiribacter salilacus TaxID=2664894 RepID=A0A6N7QP94_9GAMM|nr:H-NS histone family protein [Spiribacter salilacus]MRH77510.1 H-NS histone family protein [Spiribacter salilacus]